MNQQDLAISQLIQALELTGQELVPFAKDNANGSFTVNLLKTFIRQGLATQSSVNWKQDKLEPGYGIEITDQNEIRTTLDISPFEIVDVLPTSNIKNKIYCVPDPDGEVGTNERIEYMWIDDHWEEVGKFNPKVDLTDYLKSTDAARIYAKKSELPDISPLATKAALNVLAEQVAQLTQTVSSLQTTVASIPDMPIHDGRTYGVLNGGWEPIAGVGQSVATMKIEQNESQS